MKHTKKILNALVIFLLPFLLGNTIGECGFLEAIFEITLPPPPEPVDYNDINPYHSGGYILAADNGRIYYVNDYGFPPESLDVISGNPDLFDIGRTQFTSDSILIIIGENGTIVRSTKDNPQWSLIPCPVTHNLNKTIHCLFEIIPPTFPEHIYIVGDNGTILKSTDYGLTWNIFPFPYTDNLRDISFPDIFSCNEIIVSGDNYTLYKTTDGGETWFPIGPEEIDKSSGPQFSYNRIYFYNDTHGFVGGPNGLILKTTDGGITWVTKVAQGISQINDIYFISPDSGAAVGTNGQVRFTTDGGNNWFEEPSVTDYLAGREVKKIFALSRNHGFVLGEGNLLTFVAADSTYLDSTFVTSVEDEYQSPNGFILYQNYPNPFNPVTSIQYAVSSRQFVTLKIYDLLGNEVATLVNEENPAGKYKIEFDASGLSSGVYFYQLKVGKEFIETKKFVLLK